MSLVNGISGQVNNIINDFRNLDGVADDVMQQLSGFANISITGGLLAGAGVAGLKLTKDALDDCIGKAIELQTATTDLKIVAFGNNLLDESKLPEIAAQLEDLEDTAMNVSLNTPFNAKQIEESMSAMIKGGMTQEQVAGMNGDWENSAAKANAYFATTSGASAIDTANATGKLIEQFHWENDEIQQGLDLISKYSRAAPDLSALQIQENIGTASGTAANLWANRDNMQVTEETIQLMAATQFVTKNPASASTFVKNFLTEAAKTRFTDAQEEMANFTGDMNILGADGTNQLAQGLSGSDALGVLGTSVGDINSTITNGLIKEEEMKTYGSNLIQSFIHGINAKSAALKTAVQGISNIIGDYLAVHSPTKAEPLHTNQLWGGNLIQSFIHGMQDKDFQLSMAVSSVAQKLGRINEVKYAETLFTDMKNLEELQAERFFSRNKENTARSFSHAFNREQKENEKNSAPIYIVIQGADKSQEEIAKAVAKELEKRGLGQRKRGSDFSLTMSPYGFRMGY